MPVICTCVSFVPVRDACVCVMCACLCDVCDVCLCDVYLCDGASVLCVPV